jgi:dihydrolipoamide dehydrogenase
VKNGAVTIEMTGTDGKTESMTVEKLLVATGRGPVTDGLGAAEAGLTLDRGLHQGRHAVPDRRAGHLRDWRRDHDGHGAARAARALVVGRRHRAGRAARGHDVAPINYDQVPACTYCDPEIGSVGLTEEGSARARVRRRIGTFPFGVLGRAKMAGETEGFVKIVAEKKVRRGARRPHDRPRATELVAEAGVALRLESTVEELIRTIHAHPTMSEAVAKRRMRRMGRRYIRSWALGVWALALVGSQSQLGTRAQRLWPRA